MTRLTTKDLVLIAGLAAKGWCRELWIESLGMRAVLPPPEEEHDVKTAIGAARAEKASEKARRR